MNLEWYKKIKSDCFQPEEEYVKRFHLFKALKNGQFAKFDFLAITSHSGITADLIKVGGFTWQKSQRLGDINPESTECRLRWFKRFNIREDCLQKVFDSLYQRTHLT